MFCFRLYVTGSLETVINTIVSEYWLLCLLILGGKSGESVTKRRHLSRKLTHLKPIAVSLLLACAFLLSKHTRLDTILEVALPTMFI
jgi:hypothetical protein